MDEVGGEPPLVDCNGHGTHVAGELGGSTYGVAKSVSLVEVRVLGCNGIGSDTQVIAGVDWVTNNVNSPAVANMSLGGGQDAPLDQAIVASEQPVRTTAADGHTTLNSTQVTVADANFTSADVGQRFRDSQSLFPAGTFVESVTNSTTAIVSNQATNTSTNDIFSIGAGVSYAVAAGNSNGADACQFSPSDLGGANSATLTAAASDITDHQASFSNVGPCVDLYGPGVNITSDWPGNGVASCGGNTSTTTCILSGTSMATPHVAGTAALYLSANPTASPAAVKTAVTADATPNVIVGVTGTNTPNKLDFTGPSPPGVTATVSGPTSVHLSWTAPASNGGNPITAYNVYRGTQSGNVSTVLAMNLSPSTTTFDDTGLSCGQTFYYEVSAVNVVDPAPNDARSIAATAAPCGGAFKSGASRAAPRHASRRAHDRQHVRGRRPHRWRSVTHVAGHGPRHRAQRRDGDIGRPQRDGDR